MRKKIEWQSEVLERLDEGRMQIVRYKTIGGWIVRSVTSDLKLKILSESMIFIADRDHEWHIVKPIEETTPTTDEFAKLVC